MNNIFQNYFCVAALPLPESSYSEKPSLLENGQHRISLYQLREQHNCTVTGKMDDIFLEVPVFTVQGLTLYVDTGDGRAAIGDQTLLE